MPVCFELQQKSDDALAIQLREKILNKLQDVKTKEQLKETIISILSENDQQLDLEQIQQGNNVIPSLENYLVCSIQEPQENLSNVQIEIGELLKKAIDLICNPPSFPLPPPFPIIDISGDFLQKILIALLRLAIKILLSIIKKLLSILSEVCASGLSSLNGFGTASIIDIINQSIGDNVGKSFVGDVFKAFGINTDGTAAIIDINEAEPCDEPFSPTAVTDLKNTMKFLDDISLMLTPVEICGLLNNNGTEQAFQVVEELLNFEYPNLKIRLNNRSKISGLFKTLGVRTDPSICQLIEDNSQLVISRPDICFTEDINSIRTNLLKGKGLTDDEISEQLQKERDRNKANLEKISQIASQIKSNPNKLFGEQQEIFCKGGKQGIVSLDIMPSLKTSVGSSLDTMFNAYSTTINKSLGSYPSTVTTIDSRVDADDPVIKKFITVSGVNLKGERYNIENSINPIFIQKTTSTEYELCTDLGETEKEQLIEYYRFNINDKPVVNGDNAINIQALLGTTSVEEFSNTDKNVFILNNKKSAKLLKDTINVIDPTNIESYISLDFSSMSLSFTIPDMSTDQDKLIIYPVGTQQ
jgi:hypothetical protein